MSKSRKKDPRFAICIKTTANDMLTLRKVYEILPDESAAKSNFIRVIDDEGEDYLYPASHFVTVELPASVEQTLQHVR